MRGVLVALAFSFLALPTLSQPLPGLTVSGTSFRLITRNQQLYSPDLAGTILTTAFEGRSARVRIDAVERDPSQAHGVVWLHTFALQQPDGTWANLCHAGPDGRAQGFPLPGASRANGTFSYQEGTRFEWICTSGAQGKCVRHGYFPWAPAPDGTPLQRAHDACVLMLRADYGAVNSPATRDGVAVGSTDRWGLRAVDVPAGEDWFEAGWDAEGAVCVRRPRLRDGVTLSELEAKVPRLKGRTGAVCTPEFARGLGALVFNWSQP
ncbi:hypothetical protein FN976_00745 [Caenimonas sedimenti]|uniref:ADYC domain-containing protein n=1 Tax=Caenimonas sedimenti TaxID=2596921 RepID=A0A562ZYA5_9BURK|nr:ADYC domain-containing protein [Caenimonas sedimenti]TWO73406.1 hypothetical protein FN976_00745 [Caenimonas sedimenti]